MKDIKFVTLIGFLCFVALMLSGTSWLLGKINANDLKSAIDYLHHISMFILIGCGVVSGFLWLYNAKMNKTLRIVLMVFFITFAVLAVFHVINF